MMTQDWAEADAAFVCSSQYIAVIPNRLTVLDSSNKLVALSSTANRTNYDGIAYRSDIGGFLAVQERRMSQTTGQFFSLASAVHKCHFLQKTCLGMCQPFVEERIQGCAACRTGDAAGDT
jgi:hypothetical protein